MKARPPWTTPQVFALNRWQRCGWVHPFTCGSGNRMDEKHLKAAQIMNHGDPGTLIATEDGWMCAACDYRQIWAHDFMLDGPPPRPFSES